MSEVIRCNSAQSSKDLIEAVHNTLSSFEVCIGLEFVVTLTLVLMDSGVLYCLCKEFVHRAGFGTGEIGEPARVGMVRVSCGRVMPWEGSTSGSRRGHARILVTFQ